MVSVTLKELNDRVVGKMKREQAIGGDLSIYLRSEIKFPEDTATKHSC
jgi:hypothetical protein